MKKYLLLCSILFFLFIQKANADELTKYSESAILLEPTTGKIIYEKNINEERPPASMTKLMTLLLIMEAIDSNRIHLTDKVLISQNAASMGGSQVFLEPNTEIVLEELIKSVAIASGNDAAVALAEYTYGSIDNFVSKMNEKVKELNLKHTHFENVHGLDSDNHYSSAYDMAMIAKELLKHPKILDYTSLYEDYLVKPDGTKTWLVNTNKLVRFYDGVDGLKTGYTSKAKYCLTSTASKNNIRFLTVVMGVDTKEHRNSDTTSLLNYAFNTYKIKNIITTHDIIDKINITNSPKKYTEIYSEEEINDLILKNEDNSYNYSIDLNTIKAPLKENDVVGKLKVIDKNNKLIKETNLIVHENIPKYNFFNLYFDTFKKIINGCL